MADEHRELERVYDELKTLRATIEALREAIVGDHDKLRDKVQAQEVKMAQLATQLEALETAAKERRLKDFLGTLATSGVVAGGAAGLQYFVGK